MAGSARLAPLRRASRPLLLFALALVAVAALPEVGYALTQPQRAGDFASALRAHVAWSRFVGLGLVVAGGLALARLHRRDAALAARTGAAAFVGFAVVASAFALPAYDAALMERLEARYTSQGGPWESNADMWRYGPESVMFSAQVREENGTGPMIVQMPPLAKGDQYRSFVVFDDGDPEGFWRSALQTSHWDSCEQSEGQMPRLRPTGPEPQPMGSFITKHCTMREEGTFRMVAEWGTQAPVSRTMSVLLHPTHANVVAARVDESLLMVGVAGGLVAYVGLASAAWRTRRDPQAPRATAAALALGPALAAAAWALAAVAPRADPFHAATSGSAVASFTFLAGAGAAAALALGAMALTGRMAPRDALRWSAIVAAGVGMLAPMAAARVWPRDVAWVLVGLLGTLAVASAALVVSAGWKSETSGADPGPWTAR